MGYNNHFTGEITITPPLTWAEIQTSPPLRDTTLRLVEAITDTETGRTITTQAISVSVESGFSGFNAVEEIQALVDHHGATHTFAGHIDAQFEIGLVEAGQPGCERYVVRDGRVETLTPRLVWPGEAASLEQLTVEQGVSAYDPEAWPVADLTDEEAATFNAALAECRADPATSKLQDLLGSIWLYVSWPYVTKQLTTEQKELWADAVDAWSQALAVEGGDLDWRPVADRWWRDA